VRRFHSALLVFALGCGGTDVVFRPVDVDVVGRDPRADTLVVAWVSGEQRSCRELSADDIAALTPTSQITVEGTEDTEGLELPRSRTERGLLLAYTQTNGDVVQFACRELRFEDLERPEVTLILSPFE
jgi:hypothetical protein